MNVKKCSLNESEMLEKSLKLFTGVQNILKTIKYVKQNIFAIPLCNSLLPYLSNVA